MCSKRPCAACREIVYPLEVIKCCDQIWHRKCFRCQQCGMALSICNYRGFEKKPYCTAHYPTLRSFTFIADTPEMLRVTRNTRLFSNYNYSEAAQRDRVKYVSILDDITLKHYIKLSTQFNKALNHPCIGRGINPTSIVKKVTTEPKVISDSVDEEIENRNGIGISHSATLLTNQNPLEQENVSAPYQVSFSAFPTVACPSKLNGYDENIIVSQSSNENWKPVHQYHNNNTFQAIYDYNAREDDEVSIIEGDIILNGDPITDGWMYGTVERTGKFGMLPSNYVRPILLNQN